MFQDQMVFLESAIQIISKIIELDDNTDLSGELACAGGACEIQ